MKRRTLAAMIGMLAAPCAADDWSILGPPADFGDRPTKPPELVVYVTGDPGDSPNKATGGPGLLLMGGGTDVDSGFSQRAYPVVNGGDIVIIRTSGADGYNDYLYNMVTGPLKPNSVETMMLDTPAKANSDYAAWVLNTAELIWMAGGDQSEYVNAWKDTRSEDAIHACHARGGVVGGTSAGLAVMGQFVYDPDGVGSVTSAQAIANPFTNRINISDDFLDFPLLRNVITDSHFRNRDRMGRSLAFLARLRQDGRSNPITGIAISEATCLFINKDGQGVVNGSAEVYILREDDVTQRVQVAPSQPLVYSDILRTRLVAGDTVDVTTWEASKQPIRMSVDGTAASPFITPTDYYN